MKTIEFNKNHNLKYDDCYLSFFNRHEELRRSEVLIDTDGLNTLAYTVIEFQEKPLYTLISVSLQ